MTGLSHETNSGDDLVLSTYSHIRQASLDLCETLENEDFGLQAMAAVSPPKWHLAHTSWFFETFILKPFFSGYQPFNSTAELHRFR